MKTLSIISIAVFMAAAWLVAEPVCAQTSSGVGDKAGMQIANQGGANGVAACASCHGAKGEGNAAANFPRIAGQSLAYLEKQLSSYANGSRANPVMMPIAKALTSQQIHSVSAYYAGVSSTWSKPAAALAASLQKRGETLSSIGDEKIGVQACVNCHGPGGIGESPTYPYLAGQHGGYLTAALGEWKSGARNTDPAGQMGMIAKRLSDNDIAALAAYYASQPAPPPAAQRENMPGGSAARPAAGNTRPPAGSAIPVRGIGTEQGAPSGGGVQGPGGGGSASGSSASGSKTGDAR